MQMCIEVAEHGVGKQIVKTGLSDVFLVKLRHHACCDQAVAAHLEEITVAINGGK